MRISDCFHHSPSIPKIRLILIVKILNGVCVAPAELVLTMSGIAWCCHVFVFSHYLDIQKTEMWFEVERCLNISAVRSVLGHSTVFGYITQYVIITYDLSTTWLRDLLWPLSCCHFLLVYLFVGLMMMYLLLRTFHKMADLHGLTTYLQLPRCEEFDQEEDREPIVHSRSEAESLSCTSEDQVGKSLNPGSQISYNTINKGWALERGESRVLPLLTPRPWTSDVLLNLNAYYGYP